MNWAAPTVEFLHFRNLSTRHNPAQYRKTYVLNRRKYFKTTRCPVEGLILLLSTVSLQDSGIYKSEGVGIVRKCRIPNKCLEKKADIQRKYSGIDRAVKYSRSSKNAMVNCLENMAGEIRVSIRLETVSQSVDTKSVSSEGRERAGYGSSEERFLYITLRPIFIYTGLL